MNKTLKLLYGVIFIASKFFASEDSDGNYVLDYKGFRDHQKVLCELKSRACVKEALQQAEKAFKGKAKFMQLAQQVIHKQETQQLKIALREQQQINRELAQQKDFLDCQLFAIQGKRTDLCHQIKELNEHLSQTRDQLNVAQSEIHNLSKYMAAKDAQNKNLAAQLLAYKEKHRALEAELAQLKIQYEPILMQKKATKKLN